MIRSMTGYGSAQYENDRYAIQAEIKSVNGKFLEFNVRVPRTWQHKEVELRNLLQKQLERGSVSLFLTVQYKQTEDLVLPINKDVAVYYLDQLQKLSEQFQLPKGSLSNNIFEIPGILTPREQENDEDIWNDIRSTVQSAYTSFNAFRITEGNALSHELAAMGQRISSLLTRIEPFENERIQRVRERLHKELMQLKSDLSDPNRFEQELIYYLEKMDITEEKTRLRQHIVYFLDTMKTENSGKKLSFIAQEMGREINTIGSKANHAEIQKVVVEMKDELEKIKEQLNNVL